MDIVLFHGLQLTANDIHHAWTSTWTQRDDGNVCWPQKWLPYDLGEAVRIISVSYDAHVRTSPHNHVSEIADNLFQNFVDRRYKWQHPIVLIGHSFGGLVLKSLLVKLKESTNGSPGNALSEVTSRRAKMFSKNVSREFEQAQQDVHELRQSTFGLDKYVEEIETLVTSAGSDVTPKYLGVWGMGGVGKSVLLKTLYARAQVNNHFQGVKFIWRTVGKSPDITSIYRFLSQQLGLEPELDLNALDYKDSVPDELKKDAQSMAQQCAGLPLGLKVIGAGMRGEKRPKQWELQLKKLTESRMHDGPGEELRRMANDADTGYATSN
ncbi:unnamed protein product [Sphagnum jensenii]|uniref:NB-ARC domain-containing protein n=1 Tax=Sphagnum jensenii TaxID=128206 RepID=A0ABP1AZG2_9BRYO